VDDTYIARLHVSDSLIDKLYVTVKDDEYDRQNSACCSYPPPPDQSTKLPVQLSAGCPVNQGHYFLDYSTVLKYKKNPYNNEYSLAWS